MSNQKKHNKRPEAVAEAPENGKPDGREEAVDSLQEEVASLQEELKKAQERNDELLDLRLREQAEFDNFKKRRLAEQERQEKMALRNLMVELIDVDSNFRHALAGGEGDFEAYKKGVEMIAGQLSALLEQHGVTRIEAAGQPFDHDLHEAMLQVDEGDHEGLLVSDVMREGYLMHDQVLRLAGVKVARGSREPASGDQDGDDDAAAEEG